MLFAFAVNSSTNLSLGTCASAPSQAAASWPPPPLLCPPREFLRHRLAAAQASTWRTSDRTCRPGALSAIGASQGGTNTAGGRHCGVRRAQRAGARHRRVSVMQVRGSSDGGGGSRLHTEHARQTAQLEGSAARTTRPQPQPQPQPKPASSSSTHSTREPRDFVSAAIRSSQSAHPAKACDPPGC